MKKRSLNIFLKLILSISLIGCTLNTIEVNEVLNSWRNHNADELVASWGPPSSSYTKSDGSQILTYNGTPLNRSVVSKFCKIEFEADSKNIIREIRTSSKCYKLVYDLNNDGRDDTGREL